MNPNPAITALAMLAGQRENVMGGDAPVKQIQKLTKYDLARLKAAEAKRERKKQKRIEDVNDEMLAEASRRGLRLRSACQVRSNGLGFLFGECESAA